MNTYPVTCFDTYPITSFSVENKGDISLEVLMSDLANAIKELGSDDLKYRLSSENIGIDTSKCNYMARNDTMTIVFNAHLGNLIDELIRLIKISISQYSLKYYLKQNEEKSFFDWNKLINDICIESGKCVFSTDIEFYDKSTTSLVDEYYYSAFAKLNITKPKRNF